MNKTEIFGDVVLIAQKFFYKSVSFFCKNDEKTTLKPYMISQQIYLKKMSYVPELVALYDICPYIRKLALDNETIRVAVKDYLEGGEKKDAIIKKYGKIEDWNTSEVTDMSGLFRGFDFDNELNREHTVMRNFNEDISKWDTSNVTTMKGMFMGAESFNQPIGKWDISNVTIIGGMFYESHTFNQSIGEWDTSKVTIMKGMFSGSKSFNKPIEEWDTSNVTDMEGMFLEAESFNKPIGGWNTSKVSNMSCMFYDATSFNPENAPWYNDE